MTRNCVLICTVIDLLVYWSRDFPVFYILGLLFLSVFSMVFIVRSSLTLWFNLVFRHSRKIAFGTFNFVCSVWGMKLFRLGSSKCCVIVAFSAFPSLESSTPHFVLEILHTTMLLLYREIFVHVAASLSDVCQLRQARFLY